MNHRKTLGTTVIDFKRSWKHLATADIAYKAAAVVLLAPLTGLVFRLFMTLSGRTVLADEDILDFALGPYGIACAIVVGAALLTIVLLEQATLLAILKTAARGETPDVAQALSLSASRIRPVFRLTLRVVACTLLVAAPFVALAGATYLWLLGDYDINFYLSQRPQEFLKAVAICVVLATGLGAILFRLASSWLFALPIVLFEETEPKVALRESTKRAEGHRLATLRWIAGWALAMFILSTLAAAVAPLAGRLLLPLVGESLFGVLLSILLVATIGALLGLAVNVIGNCSFAAILFNLYCDEGGGTRADDSPPAAGAPAGVFNKFRLTTPRLIALSTICILLAITVGIAILESIEVVNDVEVTGHRGAAAHAPENTMTSIRRAIADGADWVEFDVQETSDDEIVVVHDSDFMRLSGRDLKVWDATMEVLAGVDIGSWFGDDYKEERVVTLDAVLAECKGKIRANIELKFYGHDKQLEQRVVDIVEAHGMENDVVLMSLEPAVVGRVKELRPDWTVGLLTAVAIGDLSKVDADFLAINAKIATRRLIKSTHRQGKAIHVWTVNDPVTASILAGRGVDNIITDDPAMVQEVLAQRATLGPSERLLIQFAGLLGIEPKIAEQ